MAVLGPRFCARALPSCGKRGPLLIAMRGPLTTAASLVAEHRLSNCGSRAQLLRGTRDPPRPGLEPVCPALAGRFSTTAPPGKPSSTALHWRLVFLHSIFFVIDLLTRSVWVYFWALCSVPWICPRGCSSLRYVGTSLRWLLLLPSMGSWHAGSRVQAQQLWHMGLVAPQHVGSSQTRARTHVPCIGRWILNHCATREVLPCCFDEQSFVV